MSKQAAPEPHDDEKKHDPHDGPAITTDRSIWCAGMRETPPGRVVTITQALRDVVVTWPPYIAAPVILAFWAMMPGVELTTNRLIVVLTCMAWLACVFGIYLVGRFKKNERTG